LGRPLSKKERSRIGVSSLRLFLEELLRKRLAISCLKPNLFHVLIFDDVHLQVH